MPVRLIPLALTSGIEEKENRAAFHTEFPISEAAFVLLVHIHCTS
jgi:hypothetical protein